MKRLLFAFIIVFFTIIPTVMAQEESTCDPADLEFLTDNLLQKFNAIDDVETELFVPNYRHNLFWDYVTFRMACEKPQPCETLNDTYAEAIAAAKTRDELVTLSANLTADVITCQETEPARPAR